MLVIVLGGAWAITEWLRGTMFTGFPWNPAAAALAPTPLDHHHGADRHLRAVRARRAARRRDLAGILQEVAAAARHRRRLRPCCGCCPSSAVPPDPLAVRNMRIVQPNIGQQDKWRPGFDEEAARRLATLSGPPTDEPRLLLWPEAAVTDPLEDARTDRAGRRRAVPARPRRSLLGPNDRLITGGIAHRFEATASRRPALPTASSCLRPAGEIVGRYDKAHLVPYGEYLPMRPLLSAIGLSRLAPGDVDFASGPGPRTIDLGGSGARSASSSATRSSSPARWSTRRNRPALHLQSVERRLVRPMGPAAASRPGAAARGRGRPAGNPRDADRHQRRDRRPRRGREGAAVAHGGRDRRRASAGRERAAARSPASAMSSRSLLGFLLIIGGIVLGRRRR